MSDSDEVSLFEALGIPRDALLEPPPDDVWNAAVTYAVDPNSPDVDAALVPASDDHGDDSGQAAEWTDPGHNGAGNGHDGDDLHGHLDLTDLDHESGGADGDADSSVEGWGGDVDGGSSGF